MKLDFCFDVETHVSLGHWGDTLWLDVVFFIRVKPELGAVLGVECADDLMASCMDQICSCLRSLVQAHFDNWVIDSFRRTPVSDDRRTAYAKARVIMLRKQDSSSSLTSIFAGDVAPRMRTLLNELLYADLSL